MDASSSDEFMYSPVLPETDEGRGFNGYSLPDGEYASEQTLRKETPIGALSGCAASRTTFGGGATFSPTSATDPRSMSALEELLNEIGYLGDVIVGK